MNSITTKQNIQKVYNKLLKRNPTVYENYIYYNAMICGFSINQLENIIKNSSEYNYIYNIKKNIINFNYKIKDKKIAICISGHARNFNFTYLNYIKNIINPLNADVFIHTWDTLGSQIERPDSIGIGYSESQINNAIFLNIKKLNPKKFLIENFLEKINFFNIPENIYMYGAPVNGLGVINSTARPENIISQLYSIYKSYFLLEEYEKENNIKYDLIIKARFDFNPESKISKDNIDYVLNNENIIFTLDKNKSSSSFDNCNKCTESYHEGEHDSIISDIFLFGSNIKMKKYMSLYNEYFDIYTSLIKNINDDNIIFSYKKDNIKFIGEINSAIYHAPCFFPERLLMTHLSDTRILNADLFGYIVR